MQLQDLKRTHIHTMQDNKMHGIKNQLVKGTYEGLHEYNMFDFDLAFFLIRIDLQKNQGLLDFSANVTLKGHYDMDGQVLILPIRGNGDARIKISKYLECKPK